MPRYDVRCPQGHEAERTARWDDRTIPCDTCGAPTERFWKGHRSVKRDKFSAPKWFENGVGTPRFFNSQSELDQARKEHGCMVRGDGEEGPGCQLSWDSIKKAEAMMRERYPVDSVAIPCS